MVETQRLAKHYWIQASTLGGKQKNFSWRVDEQCNLYIKRNDSEKEEIFIAESLEKIHNYVSSNEWTYLANNVDKLYRGEEKEGLGKFIYENIRKDTTYAQLSSQIVSIFTQINIWVSNGKKISIKFRTISNDWKTIIRDYYLSKDTI